jgi:hypothetical protein
VTAEEAGEGGGEGLLAFVAVLLAEPDRAAPLVDIDEAEAEDALSAGAGFEVEADQEEVEVGVF